MSVDYRSCSVCGDAKYEVAIINCEKCGENVCNECICYDKELGEGCQYYFPDYVINENEELKKEYCPYCSGKLADKGYLLDREHRKRF